MNAAELDSYVGESNREDILRTLASDAQNPIFGENNDLVKSIDALLSDKTTDEKLKDSPFWVANVKSLKLSMLDRKDRKKYINMFEAMVLLELMKTPPDKYTLDEMEKVNQARMVFQLNVDRAIGTNSANKKNERILLSTQIKEIATHMMGKEKKGIFKRLLGI